MGFFEMLFGKKKPKPPKNKDGLELKEQRKAKSKKQPARPKADWQKTRDDQPARQKADWQKTRDEQAAYERKKKAYIKQLVLLDELYIKKMQKERYVHRMADLFCKDTGIFNLLNEYVMSDNSDMQAYYLSQVAWRLQGMPRMEDTQTPNENMPSSKFSWDMIAHLDPNAIDKTIAEINKMIQDFEIDFNEVNPYEVFLPSLKALSEPGLSHESVQQQLEAMRKALATQHKDFIAFISDCYPALFP